MIALSRSALNSALTAWAMSSRSPFAEFFWGIPTKVFPFHAPGSHEAAGLPIRPADEWQHLP